MFLQKLKKVAYIFFIGPNGAGKTTLLDAICGFTKPTSGKIIYNEKYDITKYKEYELVNIGIGRKFQVPSVFKSLTVYENMELAIKKNRNIFSSLFEKVTNQENQKIEEILMLIDLKEQQDMIASDLSHGQKQWLEIGMLLAQDLKLILLDEPVAGMGRRETTKTGELLKKNF